MTSSALSNALSEGLIDLVNALSEGLVELVNALSEGLVDLVNALSEGLVDLVNALMGPCDLLAQVFVIAGLCYSRICWRKSCRSSRR